MRRVALAAGVLALATIGVVSTSSNTVPRSTAGITSVTVTGATMRSTSYTIAANTITGFTMQLAGSVLLKTVTAAFNGGVAVPCVLGVYDATTNQTPVTCTGFTQQADRSWRLVVTVS